jgi:peroxiredoxin
VIAERPSAEDRKEIGIRPRSVSGAPGETPAPATRREALEAAPDFSLQATDGSTVTLADLRGSIVVLDFWGTWALQSKQSAPEIQALHEKFKDRGVRFVGIAVKERNEEKAAKTFEERGQTYTLVTKGDSAASAYGGVDISDDRGDRSVRRDPEQGSEVRSGRIDQADRGARSRGISPRRRPASGG